MPRVRWEVTIKYVSSTPSKLSDLLRFPEPFATTPRTHVEFGCISCTKNVTLLFLIDKIAAAMFDCCFFFAQPLGKPTTNLKRALLRSYLGCYPLV